MRQSFSHCVAVVVVAVVAVVAVVVGPTYSYLKFGYIMCMVRM
jgi:hypothetical protein